MHIPMHNTQMCPDVIEHKWAWNGTGKIDTVSMVQFLS